MPLLLEVPADAAGTRLDRFLALRLAGTTRARCRRLITDGEVRVNGRRASKGLLLHAGDHVEVSGTVPTDAALHPAPEPDQPLTVLHADEHLVVVVKPAGIRTQPLRAGEPGTIASALVARFPECTEAAPDPRDAGLAQRLDQDTSGILLAARTRATWDRLRAAFRAGEVEKVYLALVAGVPPGPLVVDAAIAPYPGDRRRVVASTHPYAAPRPGALPARTEVPGALPARTEVEVVQPLAGAALVRARTHTGRRHQIRAHLAAAGYPLLGDLLYGGEVTGLPATSTAHYYLHAARVTLPHPADGARVSYEAPLPDDFARAVAALTR
ncbi:MAG: RluA family pseudouridine synthase [Deltaproteobacteria bacterium]|nr:RluA family pseudouridine synthase [Deltaproteobacteria bacterium]